jgi:hypothetical protein
VDLRGALPGLSGNLEIERPGLDQLTVRRDTWGDYRIFTVASGSVVSISGNTIANGNAAGFGGDIANNRGTLKITASTVSENSAANGGVYSDTGVWGTTGYKPRQRGRQEPLRVRGLRDGQRERLYGKKP